MRACDIDLSRFVDAPFDTMIAVAALVTGVVLAIDPHALRDAAISTGTGGVFRIWEGLYVLGALGMLAGLGFGLIRVEVSGLLTFMAAVITNAVAIGDVAGIRGVLSAFTFVAIATGCVLRVFALVRTWERQARRQGDRCG